MTGRSLASIDLEAQYRILSEILRELSTENVHSNRELNPANGRDTTRTDTRLSRPKKRFEILDTEFKTMINNALKGQGRRGQGQTRRSNTLRTTGLRRTVSDKIHAHRGWGNGAMPNIQ